MNKFRKQFETLRFYSGLQTYAKETGKPVPETILQSIAECKRDLRRAMRLYYSCREKVRIYEHEGMKLYFWNMSFASEEEAKQWKKDNCVNVAQYYPFSPTGLWFVSDLRIAKQAGCSYFVYEKQELDV